MHSWHWVLLSLFSPLFLFHCSQVEVFLPSHFALAAVQLGRVRHSNSSNLHSRQAKIHPCHQKDWSAMFRSSICWTMRNLVMEPQYFHFVAVPKVLFFFSADLRPFIRQNIPKMKYSKMMPSLHLKLVLLLSGFFSSPGFCRDSCWEWSEYISQIYEQAWIYTYGYQAWIYTHQYILEVKHEYVLTNLYKKPAQSRASIFSSSLISANFSSNVNWTFYRKFCLQTFFNCYNLSNFTFAFLFLREKY